MDWGAALLDWYYANRRAMPWREDATPYRVWISEIMLQQTQVATVVAYFERFLARFPEVGSLAAADLQDVLKLWEGLGYYRRARNLHRAARHVATLPGGQLPATARQLREIPGIGPYTAAAIASIAFGEAVPVVDGNVVRVACRLWMLAGDPASLALRHRIGELLARLIPVREPGDFNQAMMELGATVCKPRNPDCPACPLSKDCAALAAGEIARFPNRKPRREIPHCDVAVAIIVEGGKFLAARRGEEKMLGGMWELPGGKIESGETPEDAVCRECLEELGMAVNPLRKLPLVDHAYSHFSVTLHPFICELRSLDETQVAESAEDLRWLTPAEIAEFPFPRATLKAFDIMWPNRRD